MARFELSSEALADLAVIVDYTNTQWGGLQANKYTDALEAFFAQLAEFPFMGRERGDLGPKLRSFPFSSHIVYYEPRDFGVAIVRVLHGSQDPRQQLSDSDKRSERDNR